MKNRQTHIYRILLTLCCLALLLAGCRSVDDSNGTSVATIQVTPSTTNMETGDVLQLSAARMYTNTSTVDCSEAATWTSSDTAVATFSTTANGLLSAIAAGTTTISVSCSGKSRSYTMTVTGAATLQSIEVTPNNKRIADTTSVILMATGVYSDGTTVDLTDSVNWSSSNVTNLSVERSNGSNSIQATAHANAGSEDITASYGGLSDSTTLNFSAATVAGIYVTPANSSLGVGSRLHMKAAGLFSDDTVQEVTDFLDWQSSSDATATVSNVNNGVVDTIAAGTATISVNPTGVTGTTDITVNSAELDYIEVYPSTLTMDIGTSSQFTAIGIYDDNTKIDLTNQVTWTASNSDLLNVNSSHRYNVRATALDEGTVFLSASLPGTTKGGNTAITISDLTLSTIEVTPLNPEVPANLDIEFKATGIYSNGSQQDLTNSVVWNSSDSAVLKINNAFQFKGRARALTDGTVTVTATFGSKSGTSSAEVNTGITLSSVDISPAYVYLAVGYKSQLTATGVYSDGSSWDLTPYIAWQSATTDVIMDNLSPWQGVATATANAGGTSIDANFMGMDGTDGAITGSATVDPTTATLSSIEISPTNPICMEGFDIQFSATGIFDDATTLDITPFVVWKSSDNSVAAANNAYGNQGRFQCHSSGNTTVTAASGSDSGTTTLYVAEQQ